ncbi:hypothetical protein [Xanthobacter sp.]|uniref:UGSC family (seleno)protein n=1 Tax=Xanthobacter sp. TaxID=35809 RepID=UPI0035B080AF
MRIVNPSYALPPATHNRGEVAKDSAGLSDWTSSPIALFSNGKPNSQELLLGLRDRLAELRPVDNVDLVLKPGPSVAATSAMIDAVAQKYRMALVALGD